MNPKKPRTPCLNCGAEPRSARYMYCSNECQQAYATKERDAAVFKAGSVQGIYTSPNSLRAFMYRSYGKKCAICGLTEWQGQEAPVLIDHIDGNSDNGELTNLRLVCPNCDALLPTYKGRNAGNGRFKRRERYEQGKSY